MKQERRRMQRIDCSIRGHCRTSVFVFPKAGLASGHPLRPSVILDNGEAKATLVTDLLAYFQQQTPFRHYGICSSLQTKVGEAIAEHAIGHSADTFPVFIVLEQENTCEPSLENGLCYTEPYSMAGDRGGDARIVVLNADGATWSELANSDTVFVNTVLAAVKSVQEETECIREVAEASCFYESRGRAVYPRMVTASGRIEAFSLLRATELNERFARVRTLAEALETKRRTDNDRIVNLVNALRLDDIDSDDYRRGWYLCLFESIKEILTGKHKQTFNQRHREYRKTIGHPKPGTKMDMGPFGKLQRDALGQVRRIYLGN